VTDEQDPQTTHLVNVFPTEAGLHYRPFTQDVTFRLPRFRLSPYKLSHEQSIQTIITESVTLEDGALDVDRETRAKKQKGSSQSEKSVPERTAETHTIVPIMLPFDIVPAPYEPTEDVAWTQPPRGKGKDVFGRRVY
jgi:hypothetical protein